MFRVDFQYLCELCFCLQSNATDSVLEQWQTFLLVECRLCFITHDCITFSFLHCFSFFLWVFPHCGELYNKGIAAAYVCNIGTWYWHCIMHSTCTLWIPMICNTYTLYLYCISTNPNNLSSAQNFINKPCLTLSGWKRC